ncbi:hypothetical protein HPB48_015274 [Haemaphysalis longicornis]|uniref:SPRY domain-containing protein n=1 Tax=Haemaphysalis longicornis TaxID=44386 RepID=A0A9J6FVT1_HAELO|nr:hypothetical protein HPB48_015274 [Haemaphysalis longicornis]
MDLEELTPYGGGALKPSMDMRQLFVDNITVEGDTLCYDAESEGGPGLYVGVEPARPSRAYFEVELIGLGLADLLLGFLCPSSSGTQCWDPALALACCVSQGRQVLLPSQVAGCLRFEGRAVGRIFCNNHTTLCRLSECQSYTPSVACGPGDRIGCGLFFDTTVNFGNWGTAVTFFVTHNGKEVGRSSSFVSGRLHPAVVLRDSGQQVRILGDGRPSSSAIEDAFMCVDSNEEEWLRLHDVHLNGPVLEYSGRGASIVDVGLAQTRSPLNTTSHYYELEILDPGEKCCIAIGLAHKVLVSRLPELGCRPAFCDLDDNLTCSTNMQDYPRHRHPGWNEGSIAYHADDGKVFVGNEVGSKFGPKCQKGDIMGCGILFPREYEEPSDLVDNDCGRLWPAVEDDDDDEYWRDEVRAVVGMFVQVRYRFFFHPQALQLSSSLLQLAKVI